MSQRVLITGANGLVGDMLRQRLSTANREFRLLDITAPDEPSDSTVETVTGSITDASIAARACRHMDAVIHLGGLSREDSWHRLMEVNVEGTRVLLDAAQTAGVSRVVLASSVHAVGARRLDDFTPDEPLPADSTPAPDTYYGCSKAAMEALGSLYHSRFGMDIICARIGACQQQPRDAHSLMLWLSPDDVARLVEATLRVPAPGIRHVWGVSRNTRGYVSLTEGHAIGFEPVDDSEVFAADIPIFPATAETTYVGGPFMTMTLGQSPD